MHTTSQRSSARLAVLEVLLIFGTFFVYAGWPAPDVNEAHYLVKARHYWQPELIPGDKFLNSANAHLAFYWSVGWLGQFMSLTAFAWTVRTITWLLLAWGWQRLSWAEVPRPLYSVLGAALLITLMDYCHQSGEWVVGGSEAKGFAYFFVLLALAALVRGRWNWAVLLCGAGAAFHVLVGGWTGVCVGLAWLLEPRERRPKLVSLLPGLMAGLVLSLPGLVPALQLTIGSDPQVVARANWLYVTRRLGHHLDPRQFPTVRIASFLALLAGTAVLAWIARRVSLDDAPTGDKQDPTNNGNAIGRRRLAIVVAGSVLLVAIGWVIGLAFTEQPALRASLLKYYWFRMADTFVPLGASLLVCYLIAAWRVRQPVYSGLLLMTTLVAAGICLGSVMLERQRDWLPRGDRHFRQALSTRPAEVQRDWVNICEIAKTQTPPGSRFITPRWNTTFQWYAERPEVATWKNIPQDAASITEWWRRLVGLYNVSNERFVIGATGGGTADMAMPWPSTWPSRPLLSINELPLAELIDRGRRYDAQYVLTTSYPTLPLPVVGMNRNFALYRLPTPAGGKSPAPVTQ